jgi:hypothetical protein
VKFSGAQCFTTTLTALVIFCAAARGDTVVLTPIADTMLSENNPSNNFGAMSFANSGTTQNYTKNRALFRFDLAAAIPAGSKVTAASLKFEVVGQPAEPAPGVGFSLHRLLVPWGEGSKLNSGSGAGNGSRATTNEATWFSRFAFTTNVWTQPGGAATNDYVAATSAATTIYSISDYYFINTSPAAITLVTDAQLWLDQPATNFGWLLLCDTESANFTARRFGTREDSVNTPLLTIDYTPFRIQNAAVISNQFQFSFTALAGRTTTVQFNDSLATTNWQTLANFPTPPADTNLTVSDPLSATNRFYRLRSP